MGEIDDEARVSYSGTLTAQRRLDSILSAHLLHFPTRYGRRRSMQPSAQTLSNYIMTLQVI